MRRELAGNQFSAQVLVQHRPWLAALPAAFGHKAIVRSAERADYGRVHGLSLAESLLGGVALLDDGEQRVCR